MGWLRVYPISLLIGFMVVAFDLGVLVGRLWS